MKVNDYQPITPNSVDVEENVLGAIIASGECLFEVSSFLKPEQFYKWEHQEIYKAILQVSETSKVDNITVVQQLVKNQMLKDIGGPAFIAGLTIKIGSAANLETWARIVQQSWILRTMQSYAMQISTKIDANTDSIELLEFAQNKLFEINEKILNQQNDTLQNILKEYLNSFEQNNEQTTNVPTYLQNFDELTGGHKSGRLIIYGGRPGMGKTGAMISEAYNQIMNKHKVLFFSLEMPSIEIINRLCSIHLEESSKLLANGEISNKQKLVDFIDFLNKEKPLEILENTKISDIANMCKMYKMMNRCDIVYIDYLQIISGAGGRGVNRHNEIGTYSRRLKQLAKELKVPIVAGAQLSRSVESRGGSKIPQLSDLKESGDIEQDADIVNLLYRPQYYNHDEIMLDDGSVIPAENNALWIIAKHRGGETKSLVMQWNAKLTKYYFVNDLSNDTLTQFQNYDF